MTNDESYPLTPLPPYFVIPASKDKRGEGVYFRGKNALDFICKVSIQYNLSLFEPENNSLKGCLD